MILPSVTIDQVNVYKLADVEQVAANIFANYPEVVKKIRNSRVLIKPNLLFPDPPEKLTCTHPTVVEAVIRLIKEFGGYPSLGDKPVKGSAMKVCRATGILEVCEKYNVPIIEFKKYRRVFSSRNGLSSSFSINRELDDFDMIINLPKLKTHCQLVLTCAVKNLFGCVRFSQRIIKHMTHSDREAFAELLIHTCRTIKPSFTLVDGVTAMQNHGPRGGTPYQLGVLLGGENPFYVDAAVAKILNIKIETIPILCVAQNLGFFDPDRLELNGIKDIVREDFKLARLQPVSFNFFRSGMIFLRQLYFNMLKKSTNDEGRND